MSIKTWSNVQVAIQSALGTALTVSAISKASPGVVTYTGTDPSNGDYHLLEVQGMTQINNRVVRVANVNGGSNTYEAEGINTTSYDTFSSGSSTPITFGTTLSVVRNMTSSGGDFDMIDKTTIHDLARSQIPGAANAIVFNMECFWDPSDAGLAALAAASDIKAKRAVRITFADGSKYLFNGYVACAMAPQGSAQDLVTTPVTITVDGRGTFYSS